MSDTTFPQNTPPAAPVGQGDYQVQQGDCMNSIALEHGFFWNSLWGLDENRELREKRKNPNALLPGDRVTVPPLRQRCEERKTGQRWRFKRKGEPTQLLFRMETPDGKPRAGVKYRIRIDDADEQEGATDGEGQIILRIVGKAKRALLTFDTEADTPEEYDLNLGALDPISSVSGIQARLNNLGYDCGEVDGDLNASTQQALSDFQEACGLPITGKLNEATLVKLLEICGS